MSRGLRGTLAWVGAALCAVSGNACSEVSGVELTCKPALECSFTDGDFSILIPAAAIPEGLDFKATRVLAPPDSATIVPGTTWDLQPEGTTFAPRAILAVTIPDSLLSRVPGIRASELRIYRREGLAWVVVDSQSVDSIQRLVTVRLSGFSTYTVMGVPAASVSVFPGQSTIVVGGTASLTATVRSAANVILPSREVVWSSSNESVATVSATGVVTAVAVGSATITARAGTAQSTAAAVVNSPSTGPPPSSNEPTPGAGDVVIYDDDFSGYSTLGQRRARRNALVAGTAPFYFYDGPDAGPEREALDSIISSGLAGSPFAYRIRMPTEFNNFYQATMNGQVFYRSPSQAIRFNPAGSTLVVDLWLRVAYPAAGLSWIKGLELFHSSSDRTQYAVYFTSASLGWGNIHPQSNNREIYFHIENGAADAPTRFRRWSDISTGEWRKHTFVYKASSGTGVARDGVNRWFVDGEKLIDASLEGLNTGWMVDRVYGVANTSTAPYPGNISEKYMSTTGDQALLGLADDPVTGIVFPGIFATAALGGGGTIDIGRIRIWYRP